MALLLTFSSSTLQRIAHMVTWVSRALSWKGAFQVLLLVSLLVRWAWSVLRLARSTSMSAVYRQPAGWGRRGRVRASSRDQCDGSEPVCLLHMWDRWSASLSRR